MFRALVAHVHFPRSTKTILPRPLSPCFAPWSPTCISRDRRRQSCRARFLHVSRLGRPRAFPAIDEDNLAVHVVLWGSAADRRFCDGAFHGLERQVIAEARLKELPVLHTAVDKYTTPRERISMRELLLVLTVLVAPVFAGIFSTVFVVGTGVHGNQCENHKVQRSASQIHGGSGKLSRL